MGTRPDCLDGEKLALIADLPARETWLDLGLQSSNDATLVRINRGHAAADFARAARAASRRGLLVCAHVMAGLPGEGREEFLATVRFVAALGAEGAVAGIKLHNLYVPRGTALSRDWEQGAYAPISLADYAQWAAEALALLPPDLVVHRIHAGRPGPGRAAGPGLGRGWRKGAGGGAFRPGGRLRRGRSGRRTPATIQEKIIFLVFSPGGGWGNGGGEAPESFPGTPAQSRTQ